MHRSCLLFLALLCGCGGLQSTGSEASGPTLVPYHGLDSNASGQTTALRFMGYDAERRVASSNAGTLTHRTGVLSDIAFNGVMNPSRTTLALTAGGLSTLSNPIGTEHLRFFDHNPRNGTAFVGLIGQRTLAGDMQAMGSATLTGLGEIRATTDSSFYALTGDATLRADFDAGLATLTLQDLRGLRSSNSLFTVAVGDQGRIALADVPIAGSTLRLASGRLSGDGLFAFSATADTTGSIGAFFGPLSDEAGGILSIDDIAGRSLTVVGRFIAE